VGRQPDSQGLLLLEDELELAEACLKVQHIRRAGALERQRFAIVADELKGLEE
jgi:hypothetical protein